MSTVLVIEDEDWVLRMLEGALGDAGYEVVTASTAEAGVDIARATLPDCVICDVTLPDHDGAWVVKVVRAQDSRASVTPFLLLSSSDDPRARVRSLHVGGDAYMTKPFRLDEVLAQVAALVQMAARLRKGRESLSSRPPGAKSDAALTGDLAHASAVTLLTVIEMERRTGTFEVTDSDRQVRIDVATGFAASASIGGAAVAPLAAFRALSSFKEGRFSFTPLSPREPPPGSKPIAGLLVHVGRLEDDASRSASVAPPPDETAPSPPSGDGSEPIDVEADLSSYRPPAK